VCCQQLTDERQDDLADRARALGFVRVVVIDEDLGTNESGNTRGPASDGCWLRSRHFRRRPEQLAGHV
jgi:hypothetical protein